MFNTNGTVQFVEEIISSHPKDLSLSPKLIRELLEIPPKAHMGDLAYPCFRLAKEFRKSPVQLAKEIVERLEENRKEGLCSPYISHFKAEGPYVNIYFSRFLFMKNLAEQLWEGKVDHLITKQEETTAPILIDFSSPNIAKPFHVGHAFATELGQCLCNLYEAKGYQVKKWNHLGDYGTQFGKLILAYSLWGNEQALEEHPIQELLRIYVKFHQEAEKNPDLEVKAREHFKNLEQGENYELDLWKKFREVSLKEFDKIYQRLNISFDNYNGESFYSDKISHTLQILEDKGLLKESDGAQVVEIEEGTPPCILLKSDGTSTYASRDLTAAIYRYETEGFAKNIYVVGNPQALHFKQVFAVISKAALPLAGKCYFVGFGLLKMADGSGMATRKGEVIFLEDLLNEAVAKTKAIIEKNMLQRGEALTSDEVQEIAEKVGVGAILFTFVKNGRDRDILFSWEEILNFEGDTAPYLQYTYARCKSILRKADFTTELNGKNMKEDFLQSLSSLQEDETVYQLFKQMADIARMVDLSLAQHEPSVLAKYLCSLAHLVNKFYAEAPILKAEENEKKARLLCCKLASDVMAYGLRLLHLPLVEKM